MLLIDSWNVSPGTSHRFSTLLKSEIKLWGDMIRANNISAQ
jgi:hypothetical protein